MGIGSGNEAGRRVVLRVDRAQDVAADEIGGKEEKVVVMDAQTLSLAVRLAAVAWWSADVRQSTPVKAKELSLASQLLLTPFRDTNHNSPVTEGHYGTGRHPQWNHRPHSSFFHSPTSTNFTHESPLSSLLFSRHPFAL